MITKALVAFYAVSIMHIFTTLSKKYLPTAVMFFLTSRVYDTSAKDGEGSQEKSDDIFTPSQKTAFFMLQNLKLISDWNWISSVISTNVIYSVYLNDTELKKTRKRIKIIAYLFKI